MGNIFQYLSYHFKDNTYVALLFGTGTSWMAELNYLLVNQWLLVLATVTTLVVGFVKLAKSLESYRHQKRMNNLEFEDKKKDKDEE